MKVGGTIREIESEFDVHQIEKDGLALWLDLRNRFFFKLLIGKESNLVIGSKLMVRLISSFFTGFFNWFGAYDVWVLNFDLSRVRIGNRMYDRLFDYPASKFDRSLFIESQIAHRNSSLPSSSKHLVSRTPLYILERIIGLFLSVEKVDTRIYSQILTKYNVDIDPKYSIRKMVASYRAMKLLLSIKQAPKYVFVVSSYTAYGYIKALKERGAVVIEVQHGVINKEHFGYNLYADFSREYFPDHMLSFGKREKRVFQAPNRFIDADKVVPVGSFYIEHLRENHCRTNNPDAFEKVISVSLQDCDTGWELIPFLITVAGANDQVLFKLKPRRTEIQEYLAKFTFPSNIEFVDKADVYETILDSDIHLTAYSSCALEAPALGRMNILVNLNDKAIEYYKDILDPITTRYVQSPEEFSELMHGLQLPDEQTLLAAHSDVMCGNYKERMDEFLRSLTC